MQSDHTTEGAVKAILDEMEDKLLLAMQSDKGTEMCAFQWLPNSRVIHFFTSENGNIKCAMVECFQQTLQGKMHHHMMANRTQHFMHVLLALLHTCNATHHSTIDMVPRAVNRTKWVGECLYLPRCLWYMTGLRTPIPRDWVRMSKSSMLPLQIGMVNVYLVQTSPKLGPDGDGPLEFQILSSGDGYQDLSHCYLYLKCQVLKVS